MNTRRTAVLIKRKRGRSRGILPLTGLLHDWDPDLGTADGSLADAVGGQVGTLGSGTGSDTNDPSYSPDPARLGYGTDDYVTVAATPWTQ